MNSRQKKLLEECLLDKKTTFNQKIGEFIKILNAGFPAPSPSSEKWIISNDEWQRYEFLGDRVLNLVAAGYLYNLAPAEREGDLTKRMGVVSNESLAEIINRRDWDVSRLIPDSIGQQKTYGERVKGGALEAFIGALYGIAGFVVTQKFVLSLMSEEIEHFDPANNYIGLLQEWSQKRGEHLPIYKEIFRTGPDHCPYFTITVQIADGRYFEGSGQSLLEARQEAAKTALKNI